MSELVVEEGNNHLNEQKKNYNLTSYQKDLWFEQCFYKGKPIYNIGGYADVQGELDYHLFQSAVTNLIKNNNILRMRIFEVSGVPYQELVSELNYIVTFCDFSKHKESKKAALEWMQAEFIKTFAEGSFLFNISLLKIDNARYFVFLKTHHLIADGWSISLLFKEIVKNYNNLFEQIVDQHERASYLEFIEKDQEYINSDLCLKDTIFWQKKYPQLPESLFAKRNNTTRDILSKRENLVISRKKYNQILSFCEAESCSLFHFFLAVLAVYLNKISVKDEMIIGVPILNRTKARYKEIVGLFVNMIPLKIRLTETINFIDLINQIKSELKESYKHQKLAYGEICRGIYKEHKEREVLVDVSLSYMKHDYKANFLKTETKIESLSHQYERMALAVFVNEFDDEKDVEINFDCSIEIFEASGLAKNISEQMTLLIEDLLGNSLKKLSQVEIVTEKEKQALLYEFNDTNADFPQDKTVHELFEMQVSRTPERIAISFGEERITYQELNTKADYLAVLLREKGVVADSLVGIMMERSIEMIIAMFAVLKAGGAYLPFDPGYPPERIDYMLADSKALVLIIDSGVETEELINRHNKNLIIIEINKINFSYKKIDKLKNINKNTDLAYVIYTSGTTGRPKGAMIEHRNVVRLMINNQMRFDFNENDVWTMFHSFCFDFSVWEIYGALLYGGCLIIVPKVVAQEPKEYLRLLKRYQVTVLNQTPSAFYNLIHEELKSPVKELSLRYVIFGGEALNPLMLKEWQEKYPDTKLINMYGITETTVHVTYKELTAKEIASAMSNIGKPIPTLTVYIMDKNFKLLPIGVVGEIFVGGAGVCRGYLNRPELTTERFIENPYKPGEILYRSGDLARRTPNGDLEYYGRADQQIKIRGHRIEPGEIENKLLQHEAIKEVVVAAREDVEGKKYLSAYLVATHEVTISELRKYLLLELPEYMIPSYFVQLEKIPLTSNGKIDRKALQRLEGGLATGVAYEAPNDEVERKLVTIWQKILGMDKIGINDNFFELGGESLKAIAFISNIHKELGLELSIKELFNHPTIKELKICVNQSKHKLYYKIKTIAENPAGYYPVSSAQKRMFISSQMENQSINYNMNAAVIIEGKLDKERFERAFCALIERHESLRTFFKVVDGELMQQIEPCVEFSIIEMKVEQEIETMAQEFIKPFELERAPLLRVGLAKLSVEKHLLLFDMHHIISDGISLTIVIKDILSFYSGESLTELKIQYKDFTAWQNLLLKSAAIKEQEKYWLEIFREEVFVLNMPTDYPRPNMQSYDGASLSIELDRELVLELKDFALKNESTLYMVFLAVYNVLISKYSRQEDLVVGSPISGRNSPALENIIGMFVNMLALRNHPLKELTFLEFLSSVRENTLGAYENSDYQFEDLVAKLKIKRDLSRNPLFNLVFAMQDQDLSDNNAAGISFSLYPIKYEISRFDLTLFARETSQGVTMNLRYATELYHKTTVQTFLQHYQEILRVILDKPEIKLGEILLSSNLLYVAATAEDYKTDFAF